MFADMFEQNSFTIRKPFKPVSVVATPPVGPQPRVWSFSGLSELPEGFTWYGDNPVQFDPSRIRIPRNAEGNWSRAYLESPVLDVENFNIEWEYDFRGLGGVGLSEDLFNNVMFNNGSQTLEVTEGGGIFYEGQNNVNIPSHSRAVVYVMEVSVDTTAGSLSLEVRERDTQTILGQHTFTVFDHVDTRGFFDAAYGDIYVHGLREVEKT